MEKEQFNALMPYIIEDLAAMISRKENIAEHDAVGRLYESQLYALLEQEDTKLWQYSTDMLYSLFVQEQNEGVLTFPDV